MEIHELIAVPVPTATKSYSPISHAQAFGMIEENLDKAGLIVDNFNYIDGREGKRLIGNYDIKMPGFDELGMRLSFRNSYDKSMSFASVAGSLVWICSNGMISGELAHARKHTGDALADINYNISESIKKLEEHFYLMTKHSQKMKEIELSKRTISTLIGRMFLEEKLLQSTQLNIIKEQLVKPNHECFAEDNLWSLYNHCTEGLKKTSPLNFLKSHINLHEFVEKEYML